ncbi:hypothetical protein QIS74_04214 [Colletotrichum tabaci]|uniref:BTB domain-containing protein n=1 Tax=Colletotrichum tabaci TaxID=1209068 RepID=A0AAV9TLG7_9PEZI
METNGLRATPPPDTSENTEPEVRPKVSPYASPSCKVYFKSGQQFRVPRDLLCEELDVIRRSSHEIRLRHIPDEAGHVLIHYLHTGTWQTLQGKYPLDTARNPTQLGTSLHVYAAARTYKLPWLLALAEARISRYAVASPALEILVLASDACQLLGEDDRWFSDFIKLHVQQLFEDPASLDKIGFLKCFDSATPYSKMLVKLMIEICCEKSTFVYPESQPAPQAESDTTAGPEATPLLDTTDPEPEPPEEPALNGEPALEDEKASTRKEKKKKKGNKLYGFAPKPEAASPAVAAEPAPEALVEDEPVQDVVEPIDVEWGLPVKKKKKKTTSVF